MEFGYAGKILKVDLSNRRKSELETAGYAERFLGGRGFAAKLYWDLVPATARAQEPDNCFLCVSCMKAILLPAAHKPFSYQPQYDSGRFPIKLQYYPCI